MENKSHIPIVVDAELLDFANYFSDNYRSLEPNTYYSANHKYCIEYLERLPKLIPDTPSNSAARVAMKAGIMQMDKTLLSNEKYTSDFVFYLIIWCAARLLNDSTIRADYAALEYYKTTGRSMKNMISGCVNLFLTGDTELNILRIEILKNKLSQNERI